MSTKTTDISANIDDASMRSESSSILIEKEGEGIQTAATQDHAPPVLSEQILKQMEAFQERVAEFGKTLQSQMSKQRALLEAMQREKQRYLRWRDEHPSHRYDLRDLPHYLATVYMPKASLAEVEGMGRGIFATADLAPGDVVIAEEPLVFAEHTEDPQMLEALGVFVQSWQVLRALEQADPSILPVFLAQINAHDQDDALQACVQKAQEIEQISGSLTSPQYASSKAQEATLPTIASSFLEATSSQIAQRAHWLGVIQSNAFSLHQKPRKAVGVFPAVAMLNHSCQPNASSYNEGTTMIVQACVPISRGEQITHSYLSRPQSPVQQRQIWLRERFGFLCCCPACVRDLA